MLKMSMDILWRPEVGKKVEDFFNDSNYKEYVENAVAFNRKLNEERKMRLPYIDGQTGVAQRHYNGNRLKRERMPGAKPGQIYSYPQKAWRKKSYQYLRYFLQPKRLEQGFTERVDSVMTNSMESSTNLGSAGHNEDSNHSLGMKEDSATKSDWQYDDMYDEGGNEDHNSDSDFEYEDSYSRRRSRGGGRRGGRARGGPNRSSGTSSSAAKRKSHSEPTVDNDKPFSCDRVTTGRPSRRATQANIRYREEPHYAQQEDSNSSHGTPSISSISSTKRTAEVEGKHRAVSSGYCDFCLGDAQENKKTHIPEELVSCSECGRSGHPSCLQFTDNMLKSVRTYPWQCIECKTCNLCGTSEHDDQLLFCDDCDRGYHMYCLVPPIKEPPEGSWSCKLCIETFHTRK